YVSSILSAFETTNTLISESRNCSMASLKVSAAEACANTRSGCKLMIFSAFSSKPPIRSEEHTSELQSRFDLVCRLLLEKKILAANHLTHRPRLPATLDYSEVHCRRNRWP